ELSGDGGHDRYWQTGCAAEGSRRDRLEAANGVDNRADARLTLGEPNRVADFANDRVRSLLAHHGPRGIDLMSSSWAPIRRPTARSIRSPGRSPQESRSTFASETSGHVWMLRCDWASTSTPVTAPFGKTQNSSPRTVAPPSCAASYRIVRSLSASTSTAASATRASR